MAHAPPPRPQQRPHHHTEHGVERPDPYHWLRFSEDPAVMAHLEAEAAYTAAVLAPLSDLRQSLYEELLGHIQEDDASVPTRKGDWEYYTRTEQGRAYALHCRRPAGGGPEHVYLDENAEAEDLEFFEVGAIDLSPDGRYLAWQHHADGSEEYVLSVRDMHTGLDLPGQRAGLGRGVLWAADGRTLVFLTRDDQHRPFKVWRADALDPSTEPQLVFHEPDHGFHLFLKRTRDGMYFVIRCHSDVTEEDHLVPCAAPATPPRVVWPRRHGVEYVVSHHAGRLLIRHNHEAHNFEVVSVPADDPLGPRTEILPHDPATYLTEIQVFARHLVAFGRRDGVAVVQVRDHASGTVREVALPDPVREAASAWNPEPDVDAVRFVYSSPVAPRSTLELELDTCATTLLRQAPVPGYDPADYITERLWATARDGARVPITSVRRRDLGAGPHPALLSGYGSYGIVTPATFRMSWLPLLDRGFVCAIAHVRGGADLGREWYLDGKLATKQNTFDDFAACAEHLITAGLTAPDRLAISGGSAGGLLIGAVINQRPELFRAALALVPFVDALSTMCDATLPLTVIEYDEWGDPNERGAFDRIRSWSPFDNVKAQAYPHVLATAGINDPRVGYWEPAKWVARLRDLRTDDRATLLHVHLGAGHQGRSGRYGWLEDQALEHAFTLWALGRT